MISPDSASSVTLSRRRPLLLWGHCGGGYIVEGKGGRFTLDLYFLSLKVRNAYDDKYAKHTDRYIPT
ncbi:hypothetical protein C1H46_035307 [Malus baccata]|uniref:Uncharacterized protein n=1 Tax=Malus baccata TaxID=106549 RepID=A0A540KY62_MALBA|nr:hypothetical protein C1H46_035307 [Malus baccata]